MASYSTVLLDLAQREPVAIPEGTRIAERRNPLCGDHIMISPKIEDGIICDLRWRIEGCAILKASAAYLAEHVKGKRVDECTEYIDAFSRSFTEDAFREKFSESALAPVYGLPARFKCALLPWVALEDFLRT